MKNYPLKDEHRIHHAKIPMQLTVEMMKKLIMKTYTRDLGKWICVDIVKGGYSVPPTAVVISTKEKAQKACDVHNKYHGWSKKDIEEILKWSHEPGTIKAEFDGYLDKEQFEKFAKFLAWLKDDKRLKSIKDKKPEHIVTFGCRPTIHLYYGESSVRPRRPYKSHASIDDARKHLRKRIKEGPIKTKVEI